MIVRFSSARVSLASTAVSEDFSESQHEFGAAPIIHE
jgi:hypothetical protein